MDIVSHGLWGGGVFGRRSRSSFLLAFLFGVAPDLLAFGLHFTKIFFGLAPRPEFQVEQPDPTIIPSYIYEIYKVSHSLVVFVVVFILLWIIFKRPVIEFSAWGLHILFDIPTHASNFFPTPFLWPISDVHVSGIPWIHPLIFIPNVLALFVLYGLWWWRGRSRVSSQAS